MNDFGLWHCTLSMLRIESPTKSGRNRATRSSNGSSVIRASQISVTCPACRSAPSLYACPSGYTG